MPDFFFAKVHQSQYLAFLRHCQKSVQLGSCLAAKRMVGLFAQQTKSNKVKKWLTMANKVEQWHSMSNNGKQKQTMANNGKKSQNNGKQSPTMANNAFILFIRVV